MQTETLTVTVKLDEEQIRACLPRCETCAWYQPYQGNREMICYNQDVAAEMMSLYTPPGPDFGCTLHESREAANG